MAVTRKGVHAKARLRSDDRIPLPNGTNQELRCKIDLCAAFGAAAPRIQVVYCREQSSSGALEFAARSPGAIHLGPS